MKVPVSALRAGFTFSKPVYIDKDNLLVPAGVEIREKDVERLRMWDIETVETEGDIIGKFSANTLAPKETGAKQPETKRQVVQERLKADRPAAGPEQVKIAKTAKAAPPSGGVREAQAKTTFMGRVNNEERRIDIIFRNYLDLVKGLDDFFTHIASGIVPDVRAVTIITEELLQSIKKTRVTTVGYILGREVQKHELAKNSVNIAILSALIAEEFNFSDKNIRHLVAGALMHDVGMLRLPMEILYKRGGLSAAETQQMQLHTYHSYQIACEELKFPEDVGRIVIQHHERWDGRGYPRHFKGPEITLGARIVSAADAFEAMVSEKPYRNSIIGYQAMKNILSDNSSRFDPEVLKAFVKVMGIYPIGSIIRLNTGAVGRVIEVKGEAPLRPKIQIMIDEKGREIQPQEGKIIELLSEKNLFITQALNSREFMKKP
jgi:HD-GYP domain-containing protein (c-di-GMP phosphodiesterase class II)